MREIKLRAWDKTTLKFHYFNCNSKDFYHECNPIYLKAWCEPFEQYTGLKDKKGKEIYEGDIIQNMCNTDKDIGVVQLHEIFKGTLVCKYIPLKKSGWDHLEEKIYKVIGNIYENPELLK